MCDCWCDLYQDGLELVLRLACFRWWAYVAVGQVHDSERSQRQWMLWIRYRRDKIYPVVSLILHYFMNAYHRSLAHLSAPPQPLLRYPMLTLHCLDTFALLD